MDIEQLRALVEYGNDQARRFRTVGLLHYEWEALSALVEENAMLRTQNSDLESGRAAILPSTREHAEKLLIIAEACLKSFDRPRTETAPE